MSMRWVHIEPDIDHGTDSPREDDGNVGVLALWHRRLNLPREGDLYSRIIPNLGRENIGVLTRWLKVFHGATVVLPVFGYDHGQVRFKAAHDPGYPFDDQWDAGLAGLIYDTPATREATGVTPEQVEQALIDEVRVYDQWANNELYRYEIRQGGGDDDFEVTDSCGGFYSEQEAREAAEEAMSPAPTREQVTRDTILEALRRAHTAATSAVTLATAAIDTYWETVVRDDPNNPMHVPEGAPHWHVRYGAEDTPDYVDPTVFGALGFAATELDAAADREHDVFASLEGAEGAGLFAYAEAYAAHDRSDTYHSLAQNAEALHRNASSPTWLRAPRYAGRDEAENRRLLIQAATAHVGRIHDDGPPQFGIRECAETGCDETDDDQ